MSIITLFRTSFSLKDAERPKKLCTNLKNIKKNFLKDTVLFLIPINIILEYYQAYFKTISNTSLILIQ